MPRFHVTVPLAVALWTAPSFAQTCTVSNDGTCSSASSEYFSPVPHPVCGLYMAESTIPGAGIGIFTAQEKQIGDKVGYGDVCIPVVDMYWHNADTTGVIFKEYFWAGHAMGMTQESARDDMEAYCPGLDCAVNCHLGLNNVEKSTPAYDDGSVSQGMFRDTSPGVGAFTPYHNGTSLASRHIPAGGELFKNYGDEWFSGRVKVFGMIPLSGDYPDAEGLLESLMSLHVVKQINGKSKKTNKKAKNAPTMEVLRALYEDIIVKTVNKGVWESRTLNALPKTLKDAQAAVEAGEIAAVLQPHHTRDVAWLRKHGTCIDHIRPGQSTLPDAGHGAFLVRHVPANAVITISPLHHVPSYMFMAMHNLTKSETSPAWFRLLDEIDNYQVLYNYCFGDSDSTLLLCPYGSGVNYINHNKTLANVKIEWAEDFTIVHNKTAVENGTIEDLDKNRKPQLAFRYVATKDLKAGDELFLDYGDDWEEAWQEHVASYAGGPAPSTGGKYASAHYWNHEFGETAVRTTKQQELDPYPDNLQIRCHRTLLTEAVNPEALYVWLNKDYGFPCQVLDRFTEDDMGGELYTVVIEFRTDEEEDEDIPDDILEHSITHITKTDVPRSAIRFYDLPYTTDIHQNTAFRHEISIPLEIFPEQWRNM